MNDNLGSSGHYEDNRFTTRLMVIIALDYNINPQ